ncbi:MAG: hypothetical protein V9G09_02415 [Candidatus Nanopelagicales bacterium]
MLNDYHNVAVRNGCFCAHPYVRELLKPELWALDLDPDADDAAAALEPWQGMVRASLGLYTTRGRYRRPAGWHPRSAERGRTITARCIGRMRRAISRIERSEPRPESCSIRRRRSTGRCLGWA